MALSTYSLSTELHASCLPFWPYAHNGYFMELPKSSTFCVTNGNEKIQVQTDSLGRRIVQSKDTTYSLYAFGDSQLLGFDSSTPHHLNKVFSGANLIISAAPNNGPYETLSAVKLYKKNMPTELVLGFNLSTDIFRIRSSWSPHLRSPFTVNQLDMVVSSPTLMQALLLWDRFFGDSIELASDTSVKEINALFSDYVSSADWRADVSQYLEELAELLVKMSNPRVHYIIYSPYWAPIHTESQISTYRRYLLQELSRIDGINVWFAEPVSFSEEFLTPDRRHWLQSSLVFNAIKTD